MGTLKVRDIYTGLWTPISTAGAVGPQGPIGPQGLPGADGPQGPTGVSSVIVGDFGAATTPADLPPDGLIPIDWDGPGNPAAPLQMVQGWSLYYDQPTDTALDGHLFQFVGTGIDPAGWLDIGLIQGPPGPEGPLGPVGPPSDDIYVGPTAPATPETELWFDTDDTRILGPVDLPVGGNPGSPLVKSTAIDGDVVWGDALDFPLQFKNEEGPKLNLYSTNFGLGIAASTLVAYTNANFKVRKNSYDGVDTFTVDTNGALGPRGSLNVTWASGFSGTATCRYNPAVATIRLTNVSRNANCDVNVQTKLFDYPSGFPAPPDVQTGYRTLALERNDNFTRDGAGRFITLHFDGSAAWLIATGDVFYANKKFDAVITWAR